MACSGVLKKGHLNRYGRAWWCMGLAGIVRGGVEAASGNHPHTNDDPDQNEDICLEREGDSLRQPGREFKQARQEQIAAEKHRDTECNSEIGRASCRERVCKYV